METAFVAGASGVIGLHLVPLLAADGWRVVGTTLSPGKAERLRALGAEPVVVDALDRDTLCAAVLRAGPRLVIHQLTSLPDGLDPKLMPEALARNAHLRDVGTRNLVAASEAAGVHRLVAQSIAFAYAGTATPFAEEDPLATEAEGALGVTARGVASLERQVLDAALDGVVLRYGYLYGPNTGFDAPIRRGAVHCRAAVEATRLAALFGRPGIYNIAGDDGFVSIAKARAEFGWSPDDQGRR